MEANNDYPVPLEACALPGTITITPRALKRAEEFATIVPADHIVAFYWYDGMKIKKTKDAPWVDCGPGLDIGAYRTSLIPTQAIWRHGNLPFIVAIRRQVVDQHREQTIDLDDRGKVVFR